MWQWRIAEAWSFPFDRGPRRSDRRGPSISIHSRTLRSGRVDHHVLEAGVRSAGGLEVPCTLTDERLRLSIRVRIGVVEDDDAVRRDGRVVDRDEAVRVVSRGIARAALDGDHAAVASRNALRTLRTHGPDRTLRTLRPHRTLQAGQTLRPLRTNLAFVALVALRTDSAGIPFVALRAGGSGIALRTNGAGVTFVTLRTDRASVTLVAL